MDDLSDVLLEERISDNPQDWLICRSLLETNDLFGWWDKLVASDEATYAHLSVQQINRLRELRDEYDAIEDHYTIKGKQAVRKVLEEMFSHNLRISQVAVLANLTGIDVVRKMLWNKDVTADEARRRIQAEEMLHEGLYQREIAAKLGFTVYEVQNWSRSLSVTSRKRNGHGDAFPAIVREKAMALYDQGLKGKRICEILSEEIPEESKGLTREMVGQWARRSGRTGASNARD